MKKLLFILSLSFLQVHVFAQFYSKNDVVTFLGEKTFINSEKKDVKITFNYDGSRLSVGNQIYINPIINILTNNAATVIYEYYNYTGNPFNNRTVKLALYFKEKTIKDGSSGAIYVLETNEKNNENAWFQPSAPNSVRKSAYTEEKKNGKIVIANKLEKLLSIRPCIRNLISEGNTNVNLDNKGYLEVTLSKTGEPDYDKVGGLVFTEYGVVYKRNQPKAIGTYNCGNSQISNTLLANIKINWQTDANGDAVSEADGNFEGNNCDNKPLPHEIGCFSAEIGEVQSCIPGLRIDGILGETTVKKLKEMGYDMSQGLTKEIYDDIMIKCGKQPSQRTSGNN